MTLQPLFNSSRDLTLVVPVYNEAERGAESFDALVDFLEDQPAGSRLIFADDGSTDGTIEMLEGNIRRRRTSAVSVLPCPHAGKGATLRAGLSQADTSMAAFCDVDLATPLYELDRLIARSAARNCLAIGSRATSDAEIQQHEERRREIAGRAFNRLVRTWLCPGISDTQCGAKAAPTWVWRHLLASSRQNGFAWDVEVIALALRHGIAVEEMGVEWVHDERTRVRVTRDGAAMVLSVPRIAFSVRRAMANAEIIDIRSHVDVTVEPSRAATP